jgi:LEA14-like dessication related protein
VSTLAVDTWRAVNIWTENIPEVPNEFLPLTQVPSIKQMKTRVLNLKKPKIQVVITNKISNPKFYDECYIYSI